MLNPRARLIALLVLVMALLVAVPYFLLRATGYRFDPARVRFVPTGAIAVTAVPVGAQVSIDDGTGVRSKTITAFSTTAFFPDLLPGTYRITASATGRSGWRKIADVSEKRTTAFSYVRLFPESPPVTYTLSGAPDGFSLAPNGQRYVAWNKDGIVIRHLLTGAVVGPDLTGILLGDIASVTWLRETRLLIRFTSGVSMLMTGISDDAAPRLVPLPSDYIEVLPAGEGRLLARTRSGDIALLELPDDDMAVSTRSWEIVPVAENTQAMAIHDDSVSYIDSGGTLWVQHLDTGRNEQRTVTPLRVPKVDRLIINRHGGVYVAIDAEGGAWLVAHDSERFELIAEGIVDARFSFDDKKLLLIGTRELSLYALRDRIEQPQRTRGGRETITRVSDKLRDAEFLTPEEEHVIVMTDQELTIRELDSRGGRNAWSMPNVSAYTTQNNPPRLILSDQEGNVSIIPIPVPGLLSQLLL